MSTVTNFGWGVSSTTGSGIVGAILNIYKFHNGKFRRGELDGKQFKTSDEAHAAALAHGYTTETFRRPSMFIELRLPKAVKKHLKTIPETDWMPFLKRLFAGENGTYSRAVFQAGYMANQRARFVEYIKGNNPERRNR